MAFQKSSRIPVLFGLLLVFAASGFIPFPAYQSTRPPLIQSPARTPLILIPGMTGSRMENDPDQNGIYGEVWPNGDRLILDPWDLSLLVLKLAPDGILPFKNTPEYTTVRVGDILRMEYILDYYASTIAFFTGTNQGYVEGKDFFVCPYDWRKDIQEIAFGALPQTLDRCIDTALSKNPGVSKVNILAHSMGGLVSRYYMTDEARAKKVHRLITLGSPFLGAPKIALALMDKLCFAEAFGMCFTNPDVLFELIQNYPAAYQIAPGSDYFRVYSQGYIRRDRDADGDGRRDGYLDFIASQRILGEHNLELAQKAQDLYTRAGGWGNGGTNGTEVFAIVGDQHAAIGTIVEYEKRPWYNPWGPATIAYRSEVTNGDGTVPLRSADMRDGAVGVDLSGGVPIFYFDMDHGELPKNAFILQLAASIFSNPNPVDVSQLIPSEVTAGPRMAPLPLNGSYLTIDGPVEVEVRDETGKQLARPDTVVDEQNLIADASYTELGSTTFVFLPEGGLYEVRLSGQQEASADIRLQKIVADEVAQTILYDDLPVTANSLAILVYDPQTPASGDFSLDQDGNGTAENVFPPSHVLDARESRDVTAPTTSISFQAEISSNGRFLNPVTVILTAVDDAGGSGVAKVEYSLDEGKTVQRYQEPFEVDPQAVELILAKATDRAGNEEARLASASVSPRRIYLPAMLRP